MKLARSALLRKNLPTKLSLLFAPLLSFCTSENPINSSSPNSDHISVSMNFVPFRRTGSSHDFSVAQNEVLVTFNFDSDENSRSAVHNWLIQRGARRAGEVSGINLSQYVLRSGDDLNSVLDSLTSFPAVLVATPNMEVFAQLNPSPNFVGTPQDGFWWIDNIRARDAWTISRGSSNISIGIVDGGIHTLSGHFTNKIIRRGLICRRSFTDVSFVSEDEPRSNCDGIRNYSPSVHGTAVASLAAASGSDELGGVGLAWNNPIVSVDFLGLNHRQSSAELSTAIKFSVDSGTRIINASIGPCVPGTDCDADALTQFRLGLLGTVDYLSRRNSLLVLASGNQKFKSDDAWLPRTTPPSASAVFNSNVLVVGATDNLEHPLCNVDYDFEISDATSFSTYTFCNTRRLTVFNCLCPSCGDSSSLNNFFTVEGSIVEISAPGYRISLPDLDRTDSRMRVLTSEGRIYSGTSASAPLVAGTAALMLSVNPTLSAPQVKRILLDTARRSTGCRQIGRGILDAAAAVRRARDFSNSVSPINTSFGIGHSFRIRSTDDGGFICAVGWVNSRLIKLSRTGTLEWEYNPQRLPSDTSGNYIWDVVSVREGFVGVGMVRSSRDYRAFVFKINSSGNLLWEREIPSPYGSYGSFDQSAHLALLNDDSVAVVFRSASGLEFRRFNSSGNSVASSTSLTSSDFFSISKLAFNGSRFVVSGSNVVPGTSDPFHNTSRLLSFSPSGDLVSDRSYSNSATLRQNSIASFLPDNRLILVEAPENSNSISVSILSENGASISTRSISLSSSLRSLFFRDLISVRSGGFLLCGVLTDSQNDREILLVRLDSSGNLLWQRIYGGPDIDVVSSALETDFGFLISGSTGHDANVFSIDLNGNLIR